MEQEKQVLGKLRNMSSIYLTCDNKILLLYRQGSNVVNDVWVGSAGGHFEECELNDTKACVLRELYEELHIDEDMLEKLSLRYITLRRTGEEIRQNYYFFAELKNGAEIELNSNEGSLKWFPFDELSDLKMPFTAQYVISHWLNVGKHTTEMYGGIANGVGVTFVELPAF